MSMNYTDEEYHQMTVEELFKVEVKPNLFAVSRIFAEAHKQMNVYEYKAFTLGLSRIDWTQPCPDTIYLDKKELASVLGINPDTDHASQEIWKLLHDMPKHSFIEFSEKGKYSISGNFVRTIAKFKNVVRIRVEDEFFGCFGNLDGKKEVSKYITMWSADIYSMRSERSVLFYELLRDNSDTRLTINSGTVGIKKFKEMFNIPKEGKGSYMREKGGFNRTEFEHKIIDPICEDLAKTEMIRLHLTPEGKYYEKVKQGNRVMGYKFYWSIQDPKPKLEEPEPEEVEVIEAAEVEAQPEYLMWTDAVKELNFTKEEIEAIGERLYIVPRYYLPDTRTNIHIDRLHFMSMLVKDMKLADSKKRIKNKCKYLITILENKIKGED